MLLSQESKKLANICTYCPKMCHFSCPVAEAEKNEAYTPWGKQQTAKLISEKVIPLNSENALSAYKCLMCRASSRFCDYGVVVADSLHEFREKAVANHVAPLEVYDFERKFRNYNNPYGQDLQKKVFDLVSSSWRRSKVPVLFFPTCHALALNPQLITEHLGLFQKLKIDSVKVWDESFQCCGHSLWALGFKGEFEEIASIQTPALQSAKTIVVSSPECAWTLKVLYPRLGFALKGKVLTLSEFVGTYLKHFPFRAKPRTPIRYFYHDSCYLARYLGQVEEPRRLLKMVTGFEPQEFSWRREQSLCCGAGGGYSLIAPAHALSIVERHLAEMTARKVKILVTACPQGAYHFKQLGHHLIVKDLVSFLGENLLSDTVSS